MKIFLCKEWLMSDVFYFPPEKRHNFRIDPDMFQEVGVPYDLGK